MVNPQVSIIVPVYNVSKYLKSCVNSIANQELKDYEVIFINDGSTDDSLKVLQELTGSLDNIYIYSIPNKGVANARNYGLSLAKGKYIYFCDPDDELKENLLLDNIRLIEEYDADMVIFGLIENNLKNGNKREISYSKMEIFHSNKECKSNLPKIMEKNSFNSVWTKIYRKDFLIKHNFLFPDISRGEDAVFNWNIFDKITTLVINPQAYYIYNTHREGSICTEYNPDFLDSEYYLLKHVEELIQNWGEKENLEVILNNRKLEIYVYALSNDFRKNKDKKSFVSLYKHPLYKEVVKLKIKEMRNYKNKIKLFDTKFLKNQIAYTVFMLKHK